VDLATREETEMERDILCGRHLCQESIIDDSRFVHVGMSRVEFDDVCMEDAKFSNINMQKATIHYVNMKESKICDCHLVDVEVTGGEIDGMRIHGILVADMMAAYKEKHGQ
jgi:uncharacterized protein YjbI with pentapeptide repeats